MTGHPPSSSSGANRVRQRALDFDPPLCWPDTIAGIVAGYGAERLRYVAAAGRWMVWDGTRWCADDTRYAFDLARWACRDALNNLRRSCANGVAARLARFLGAPAFVAQVLRLAGSDRRLAMAPERFDADRDLINTPAGIVDTRTGAATPHRPDAYLTRIAAAAPAEAGTPCPLWSAWLDRLAEGNSDLLFYLQRVAGRALTGRDPGPALGFLCADDRRFFVDLLAHLAGDRVAPGASAMPADLDLADRLAAEYPAILRWAIEGALAWRRIGLAPPPQLALGRSKGAAEAALGRWLEESTERSPACWASAGDLYAAWQGWAGQSGADPGSHKRFSQALEARGFQPKRRRTGQRGFTGLALRRAQGKPQAADDPSSVIIGTGGISRPSPGNLSAEAQSAKAEGGLSHGEPWRGNPSSVITAGAEPRPSPSEAGRGCEPLRQTLRSERARAGSMLHADASRLPETRSLALTLPLRGRGAMHPSSVAASAYFSELMISR